MAISAGCDHVGRRGTWVPMAAVQFAAVTAALLAGWMAVRADG